MNIYRFVLYFLLSYFAIVYLWARFRNLYIKEIEAQIFPPLFHLLKDKLSEISSDDCCYSNIPISYGEKIHDAIKDYTNNDFDMTFCVNETYSEFHVPCYTLDIVPKNNNIDNDLPIIEVQALDRFRKCALCDHLLASRIKSEKSLGKVFLRILYASNENELRAYNHLLCKEKQYADKVSMRNAAPMTDNVLSEALNLFDDTAGGIYVQH